MAIHPRPARARIPPDPMLYVSIDVIGIVLIVRVQHGQARTYAYNMHVRTSRTVSVRV